MPRKGDEIENLRYYYPVGNTSHIIGSTAADGNYFGFAFNRSSESRRQMFEFRKSCVFPTNDSIRDNPKQPPGKRSKFYESALNFEMITFGPAKSRGN